MGSEEWIGEDWFIVYLSYIYGIFILYLQYIYSMLQYGWSMGSLSVQLKRGLLYQMKFLLAKVVDIDETKKQILGWEQHYQIFFIIALVLSAIFYALKTLYV